MAAPKILVITNRIPLPAIEADAQDRLEGVLQLKRLGFQVRLIAKCFDFQDRDIVERFSKEHDIEIDLIPYEFLKSRSGTERLYFATKHIVNPFYWDGAAYEYAQPATKKTVDEIVEAWQPQAVFVDSTFLWPLYSIFRKRRIPIITRSLAFEANQYLRAGGWHYFKFLTKSLSEIMTVLKSDLLLALTPEEERLYGLVGAKNKMMLLPLRNLPKFLAKERAAIEHHPINIFFSGSAYSHLHNRRALEFILQEIWPLLEERAPGRFLLNVTGKKLPPELNKYFNASAIYHGLVDDFGAFLKDMDIALVPLRLGTGMQQKIFEPLCRGIPTVTSPRGLAGFPFRDGEELLLAESPEEFVSALIKMEDVRLRKKLSQKSIELCRKLFSQDAIDATIVQALKRFDIAI